LLYSFDKVCKNFEGTLPKAAHKGLKDLVFKRVAYLFLF